MDKEGDTMRENGNSRGNGKLETYLVIQYMSTYPKAEISILREKHR